MENTPFFDLRGAASLVNATHSVDDCFRGLLIVHEDRVELTWSGVSTFEVVIFSSKGRDQKQVKNDRKYTFFDLTGAASLVNATHPVDDCFRGLLIVHEDRF